MLLRPLRLEPTPFLCAIRAGAPLVKGAAVEAEVLGDVKGDKLYIFKFKRRKNYRRKTGHRQKYTEVRITDVTAG